MGIFIETCAKPKTHAYHGTIHKTVDIIGPKQYYVSLLKLTLKKSFLTETTLFILMTLY